MSYYNGPKIVAEDLRLCVDAANLKSYAGSGTTWDDISGYSNAVTLNNTPTFSTEAGGCFVFNGSSQYANKSSPSLPSGAGNKTVLVWAKPDSTGPADTYTGLVSYGGRDCGNPSNSVLLSMNTNSSTYYVSSAYWCNDYVPNNLVINKDAWNMIGIVARGAAAVNNAKLICANSSGFNYAVGSSSGYTYGLNTNSTNLCVGCTDNPGRYMKGSIAMVLIYNRELTDAELVSVFNATKTRFRV